MLKYSMLTTRGSATCQQPRHAAIACRQRVRQMPVRAFQASAGPSPAQQGASASTADVLLIGATGGTGSSILKGFQAGGLPTGRLRVLTTNAGSDRAQALKIKGLTVVQGNLDDPQSLQRALDGVQAVYCHALSKDQMKADPQEVTRGRNLATAAKAAGVQHVVYNGTGGYGSGCPMVHMNQKHRVQDLLTEALPEETTTFMATLFMEEIWKHYTRPKILEGTCPLGLATDTPLQLVAVRDMGLAAATAFQNPSAYRGKAIELAGDELTPRQMCEAFAAVQGTPVEHQDIAALVELMKDDNPDLYHYNQFLNNVGYKADLAACRKMLPGLLTFREFLDATHWADPQLTYEGGVTYYD